MEVVWEVGLGDDLRGRSICGTQGGFGGGLGGWLEMWFEWVAWSVDGRVARKVV